MKYLETKIRILMLLIMAMTWVMNAQAEEHRLTVTAVPAMAGSFNTTTAQLEAGKTIQLCAYSSDKFSFVQWKDASGAVVSKQANFIYTMPSVDTQLTAEYVYNPANPSNPAHNYWNKNLGEVIVDDFTQGSLQGAVKSAINGSNASEVMMITVAGQINSNDFGVINTYGECTLLDLSRVSGVTQVPSYAFDYTKLESVYFPSTIEKIGYRAFYECKQLSSLIVYAMTPPTLESSVFTGVQEGLVVYVPAAAIAQYREASGWKSFTIQPIQEDIRNISVSLPDATSPQDYAQMWLELTNTKSGQRVHYVMTDRQTYTFGNIIRNTTWNVALRNERGDVFGQIDNVEVKDEDVAVTFASLSKPQNVSLTVLTPDGKDITSQLQVTWMDALGNYVTQGNSLSGLPVGYKVNYRMMLSQQLAMQFNTPATAEYTMKDGGNAITCQLQPIKQLTILGKVKDASTGLPLSGAVISASQTFGGKYSKTLNAKTDNNGAFSMEVFNVPTSIAIAASDYVSQTIDCSNNEFNGLSEFVVPDVSLKSITGATISVGFTYTTVEGETQNWYSDYQNVSFTLYNTTKNRTINQYSVQYPQIVLLEEVEDGDVLRLTATSRANAFKPVETSASIAEQRAEATFSIIELGSIEASFSETGNASVVGSLYDASGKLLKTSEYSNAQLIYSNLPDGRYTLVSMGSSHLFNTIYDLAQLPQTGLAEGTDYVKNMVEVKSGAVSHININEVPTLDESKLYYTGDNTLFTVNKPSIVAGNYLTLTGRIDFKPAYATNVSNVQLIVDLPESCEFVENSVMVGNSTSSYTLNGNRITIPMGRYTDRVRFCIIPTLGGEYAPSAFVQFDLNGETITQPIGFAVCSVSDLSISVPATVAKNSVPISGTAIGTSEVKVYDNGVLIGQTTSIANGTWAMTCALNEPYNLSRHQIYAKVTTKSGLELQSETKDVEYNMSAIEAKTVTMSFYNKWLKKNIDVTFDLQNKTIDATSYMFYTRTDITFVADLTNNDTTVVKDVTIRVYTDKNNWRNLAATYDAKSDRWVAVSQFGSEELPVGVEVEMDVNTDYYIDANVFEKGFEGTKDLQKTIISSTLLTDELASRLINVIDSDDFSKNEVNELMDELLASVNFQEKISLNDKSVSELLNESENLLSTNLDGLFNIEFNDYKEISNYLDGFSIETRNDLNEESLVNEGFQKVNCTDGKEYFYKYTDSEYIIAYLPLSIYIVYNIKNIENGTSVLHAHRAGDVNDLTTWQGKVYLLCDKLNTVVSAVTNAVDGVINQVDALKNSYLRQSADNLGKLLQDAEEPFLLKNEYEELVKANAALAKKAKTCEAITSWLEKNLKNFRVSNGAGVAFSLFDVYSITNGIKDNGNDVINLYYAVPDCPNDSKDDNLRNRIRNWGIGCFMFYAGKLAADIVQINSVVVGVTGAVPTGGTSLAAVGIALGVAAGSFAAELAYSWQFDKNKERFENEISRLKCKDDDKCPRCGKDPCECPDKCPRCGNRPCTCPDKCPKCGKNPCVCDPPQPQIPPIHDPSGYVYEGVASNRLQGVTASCYYKETVEDMYGDLHENVVLWNAEDYAQENPLFTDEYGMYRWDVPKGLWQVKFEKEGYETTYSEWLPVPPPQLEVNIGMVQARQPEVKKAHAYEDGVEVEFDKYMLPSLLNIENILVSQNGEYVEGEISLLNEETAYQDESVKYASKIRFVPKTPFTAKEVTLTVANRVKSYAGIQMQDCYQQTFDIEQELKEIKVETEINVTTSKEHTLQVEVLPVTTSSGKTLKVKSSSDMIVTTSSDTYILDEEGKANVIVKGELPGSAALTFSVEGYDLSATTSVNVSLPVSDLCAAPTASVASGSKVSRGTEIRLSCATEGAIIYYTLDGSCPCDNTDARKVYDGTPIVINEDVTIKAMAVAEGVGESDVAGFTYTIKKESLKYYTYESLVQTLEDREGWTDLCAQKPNAVGIVESAQAEWASQQKNVLVKNSDETYTCDDFLLADLSQGYSSSASEAAKTGFFTPVSFTATKGTYKRQAYAGYNTLCLPFNINVSELSSSAKVFTFASYDADKAKIVFKAVSGTIAAGTPCIVKEKTNVVWTVDLAGKTIVANQPSEESHMRGTYVTTDQYQGIGYSPRSSDNVFAPLTKYLHPFRACFSIEDLNNAGARGSIDVVFVDEDGVTVIDEISATGRVADAPKTIYTLGGQRINEIKRSGLYIVDGEKVYVEVE